VSWLGERLGKREPTMMRGAPSWAATLGWALVFLLALEAVTGAALAAFYSPSTTDAWASVAYIQDQAALGWLIRGLHFHGGGAIAIVAGAHLLQTALFGAYKKPRELTWWVGILLLVLVLAWAITGYVLRWDQAGYWANKVEVGIAAGTPGVGSVIRALAIGGNDYGNLTLTRFYALHIAVLPALVFGLVGFHLWLAKKHGNTPRTSTKETQPRFPGQTIRDAIVMAAVFAALLAYVVSQHGADLAGPADPSQAFDARPLWYFRWLFLLRELAGSAEKLVAMAAPAVVGGLLVALPLIDRAPDRTIGKRLPYVGIAAGLMALIAALTLVSVVSDNKPEHQKALAEADKLATIARDNAVLYGVPATGALGVYDAAPFAKAKRLFEQRCKDCHDGPKRKGPLIVQGHGNRAWLRGMISTPSGDAYWGHTKLAKTEGAMKPMDALKPEELDAVVEWLWAESGASDIDATKRKAGEAVFDGACSDCHSREEGVSGNAPALATLGSRAYYLSYISNPKSALHMGKNSEMPRFDAELSLADRDELAAYLTTLSK